MEEIPQIPSLQSLPPHLLLHILTRGNLAAADLASVEACCYSLRAAHGILPLRFKSVPEIAALELCRNRQLLFSSMTSCHQIQLLTRCQGSWKLLLRFLEATEQANVQVKASGRNLLVVAGKYHTIVVLDNKQLLFCGSDGLHPGSQRYFMPLQLPIGVLVSNVASSQLHTAFITINGELFVFGKNVSGCCGVGHAEPREISKATLVETMWGIPCKQVVTGANFTIVLTMEGHLYSCGANGFGQLGHGDVQERHILMKIQHLVGLPSFVRLAAGVTHSLALTQDGELYSWGYGSNFSLGHAVALDELQPRLVEEFQNLHCFIIHTAAGADHSVAIDSNGKVYTWGKGYCGTLGHGDESDTATPKFVESLQDVRAVQACASRRKTFVLADTGMVFAFGWMCFGSLCVSGKGISDKVMLPHRVDALGSHRIAQISTGSYHTLFISTKGVLLGCGDNDKGQLGLGDASVYSSPTKLSLDEDHF